MLNSISRMQPLHPKASFEILALVATQREEQNKYILIQLYSLIYRVNIDFKHYPDFHEPEFPPSQLAEPV